MMLRKIIVSALLLATVSACDSMPSWLGGSDDDDKPKLPGNRIDVLSDYSRLKADDSLGDVNVVVPDVKINENWRQAGGSAQGMTGNLQISGFKHSDRESIGDSNKWEQPLYTAPIAAGNTVYAMDSKGYITAHEAANISKVKWTSKSVV